MTILELELLHTIKRAYLQLQIMAEGNILAVIATDLTRATLRDAIAKATGASQQRTQEAIEEQAREQLRRIQSKS